MTPFQKAVHEYHEGRLKTPDVTVGSGKIDYFAYQLASHKAVLKTMSAGIKYRYLKLKDLKYYYGLKGRTAKACYDEFVTLIDNYTKQMP